MSKLKRLIFLGGALLLLGLYAVAIYFALSSDKDSGEIVVYCFASAFVISVFIAVLFRVKKYLEEKENSPTE